MGPIGPILLPPAAFNPDPPFRAVLITAFVPVSIMAPVLVVAMKPDPAILPYPMASHPEKIRAGRRGNLFAIGFGWPVFIDPHLGWRRTIMIIAISVLMTIPIILVITTGAVIPVIAINPVAIDPNPAFIAAIPVAWHPGCRGSRSAIPMAPDPHPLVPVSCPVAFHPEKVRAGRWAPVFVPGRRRSFAYDDGAAGDADANGNMDICPGCERCAGDGA
jgi:hypothetical protein